MKHLICTLALLAWMASIASAQDNDRRPTAEERIREISRKLASENPAERAEAMEEIQRLVRENTGSGDPVVVTSVEGDTEMRFEVNPTLGTEKLRGTWSDNGTKGQYTLTSLGKGRYELLARSVDAQGTESKYSDKGNLEELRKKYPFLRKFSALYIGPGRTSGAVSGTRWNPIGMPLRMTMVSENSAKAVPLLGISVRRPSKELEYHLKLPTETTWIIESVTPGKKGANLGLKRYDLITGVDGEDLTELAPLRKCEKSLSIVRRSKPVRIALPPKDTK